jgi:hypothetical protein
MSPETLLLLALLVVPLGAAILLRRRRKPKTAFTPLASARGGLVFQRPARPTFRAAEMRPTHADSPPMFAHTPAVLDGEIAPDRLSSSSFS